MLKTSKLEEEEEIKYFKNSVNFMILFYNLKLLHLQNTLIFIII